MTVYVSGKIEAHGSMTQSGNSTDTTINTVNVWEQVLNYSAGLLDNATFASSAITIGLDGDYDVTWTCGASVGATNKVFEFSVSVNDVIQDNLTIPRKFATLDIGAIAGTGLLRLHQGDVLKFEARNLTDATDVLVVNSTVTAHRI
jgi:hypothetical protein